MASELESRILDVLKKAAKPVLAREIAVALKRAGLASVDRRRINQVLYHDLSGRVRKDDKYRWSLVTPAESNSAPNGDDDGRQPEPPPDPAKLTLQEAYQVLGMTNNATLEEIRQAYRQKISEWHPDKVNTMAKELREFATRMTARINKAYEMIKSSRKTNR